MASNVTQQGNYATQLMSKRWCRRQARFSEPQPHRIETSKQSTSPMKPHRSTPFHWGDNWLHRDHLDRKAAANGTRSAPAADALHTGSTRYWHGAHSAAIGSTSKRSNPTGPAQPTQVP